MNKEREQLGRSNVYFKVCDKEYLLQITDVTRPARLITYRNCPPWAGLGS
jgi:hypothetical protein